MSAAVLFAGVLVFRDRWVWVRDNHDIGHADAASYALQGRGLARGEGLKVNYVSTFFLRYDPSVRRYEDHWPPFLGFVLAPVFRCAGADAAVARGTTVWVGSVMLALSGAWLGLAATRRIWAGLAVATVLLLDPGLARESMHVLCDVPLAALVAGFTAAVLTARAHPRAYVIAGALGALAFYAKGSQVVLLAVLPLLAVLGSGFRALRSRRLHAGLLVFVLMLLPWWVTMWRNYGNPFHSTQNYVSAYYGVEDDWDEAFYRVYWGRNLPGTFDRFRDRPRFVRSVKQNLEVYARTVLLGTLSRPTDWFRFGEWGGALYRWFDGPPVVQRSRRVAARSEPRGCLHTGVALLGLAGLVFGALNALGRLWQAFRPRCGPKRDATPVDCGGASLLGGSAAVLSVMFVFQAAFVILFWRAQPRFALVLLPLTAAASCVALEALVGLPLRAVGRWLASRRRSDRAGGHVVAKQWDTGDGSLVPSSGTPRCMRRCRTAVVVLLCLSWAVAWACLHGRSTEWIQRQAAIRPPAAPFYPPYYRVAQALREVVPPDSVVMSRNPWELLFYAPEGLRAVGLPYASADVIMAVARHYGVKYLLYDRERPGLRSFLRQPPPGVTRVLDRPYPLYAIDWNRFPTNRLADL